MKSASLALALLLFTFAANAQSNAPSSESVPVLAKFPFENTVPLKIVRETVPSKPFTVIGPRGAILGQQDGSFEAWIFPWKIFSNLRITAEMQNYSVPIDVNDQAAVIEARPDHTTITFSHANFTVREILFAPHDKRATHIAQQLEKEYFLPGANFYAFSRNADGTLDTSPTLYPACRKPEPSHRS